jgi:hypothetical protein
MVYVWLGIPVNDIIGDSFQPYGTKVADGLRFVSWRTYHGSGASVREL